MDPILPRRFGQVARLVLGGCLFLAAGCQPSTRTSSSEPAAGEGTAANPGAATGQLAPLVPAPETDAALPGAWRLVRTTDQSRTAPDVVKIMAENSFTFAEYDLNQKRFISAGGGLWSADKGRYTETTEYNTKDSTRVGADLSFDYEVKNGDWHHRGKSSTGNPIYEIWALER